MIEGGAGKDRIVGAKGNDTLTGDGATDTFVFAGIINKDRITDFDTKGPDQDVIDIRTYADIKSFEDLIDNHASEAKGNVTLELGAGNVIIVEGVTIATLAEADFLI